jgi:hypothetical protein
MHTSELAISGCAMTEDMKSTSNAPRQPNQHRRESRIALSIEIEVNGIDRDGHPFHVITKTFEVSEWGCSFYLPFDLSVDSVVSLNVVGKQPYCLPKVEPVIFQIMNSMQSAGCWLMGASKAQPEQLWKLDGANIPSVS